VQEDDFHLEERSLLIPYRLSLANYVHGPGKVGGPQQAVEGP